MSYFKKSHTHKPKKGMGSYDRTNTNNGVIDIITDPREIEEAFRKDQEAEDKEKLSDSDKDS